MEHNEAKTLLRRMVENQAISVRTWLEKFRQYKDFSSVRNATESMARWYGMYKAYHALYGDEPIPETLSNDFEEFSRARGELVAWQPT